MKDSYEYIIIGSGPSSVMAAQTLVESGKEVAMLDVGFENSSDFKVPDADFITLRKTDIEQYKYLIGPKCEGIDFGTVKSGAQVTPGRSYMNKMVNELAPIESDSFHPIESFACGGLGVGWGLGCYTYTKEEIEKIGLKYDQIMNGYKVVSDRIGISCGNDSDLILQNEIPRMKPTKSDNSFEYLFKSYNKNINWYNRRNIKFYHPSMAILTEIKANRLPTNYYDMDFYHDNGMSNYRPYITLNILNEKENFSYLNNLLVTDFAENNSFVQVNYINIVTKQKKSIKCKKLILACGALGSARIVLRSYPDQIKSLPYLCNPYYYLPCLNLKMLGKELSQFKTSMAQAMMIYDHNNTKDDLVSVALFSYRSLMLFRLLNQLPFGVKASTKLLRYIHSAMLIAGIHFPDSTNNERTLKLIKDNKSITEDKLEVKGKIEDSKIKIINQRISLIKRSLFKLGCVPLFKVDPGFGGSIHYAGTIPFNTDPLKIGTINSDGKLNTTNNVYIADGSGFQFLPAKGITFTLMANAHNVATNALKS